MASLPLSIQDVYGDQDPETIVDDVYGDGVELLVGHLTTDQVEQRLAQQPWWHVSLSVDPATLDYAWVTFDEHAPGCSEPNGTIPGEPGTDGCDCTWQPWILYHWRDASSTDPEATAVTFAQLNKAVAVGMTPEFASAHTTMSTRTGGGPDGQV